MHSIRLTLIAGLTGLTMAALASPAAAKEYVDYSFGKGIWEVNQIEVDPNHVDDYLVGLKQSQVPGFEVMKRHHLIDDYWFMVRNGYTEGHASVLIGVHFVNADALAPDQARDQMIEKEIEAGLSDAQSKAAVAGYEKYRKFIDDGTWLTIDFKK
jgi:hypothetical protein